MSRYHSYLNSAKQILQSYDGAEPLATFLKSFFSRNKKFGSKDRKQISHLCYCFFRMGNSVMNVPIDEKLLTGMFLCSTESELILQNLNPDWNEKVNLTFDEKLNIIDKTFEIENVFPWKEELSESIDHAKYCKSFLIQPDLFLRLRPGKEEKVKKQLQESGIEFNSLSKSCLSLPNSSKIDTIIELDKDATVQDYNSQRTGEFLQLTVDRGPLTLWDCCAGSGGKSIMAYDINPNIELTVSDNRESILVNLKKRFQRAGIKSYSSFVSDLTHDSRPAYRTGRHRTHDFDFIIADVPCTGSGTWNRTPEQLYFFEKEKIDRYASIQKKIIANVIPQLKPGGYLLYITCSVFKKENEEVIDYCKEKLKLRKLKMEVLNGYDKKSDTLFAALLTKEL